MNFHFQDRWARMHLCAYSGLADSTQTANSLPTSTHTYTPTLSITPMCHKAHTHTHTNTPPPKATQTNSRKVLRTLPIYAFNCTGVDTEYAQECVLVATCLYRGSYFEAAFLNLGISLETPKIWMNF